MKKAKKEKACYGLDLMIYQDKNFREFTTDKFCDVMDSVKGFIGLAPYAEEQTFAAIFETPEARKEAHDKLLEELGCETAFILELAYIPE